MKNLMFLFLLASCGKVKHTVELKNPPRPIEVGPISAEVGHTINIGTEVFQKDCANKYKDVLDEDEKTELINDCVVERVNKLIDALADAKA